MFTLHRMTPSTGQAPEPKAPPTKLIVLCAFDRDEEGTLQPAFEPREMPDERRAVMTAKEIARRHTLCAPESVATTIRDIGVELRIIGAQFQKSPLGIVSRADNPIDNLTALAGRILSVPDLNRPMVEELLAHAGLRPGDVELIGYSHDPVLLIERHAAGLVDFVVDPQYRLAQAGVASHATLLFDLGAPLPNNLVVVTEETYQNHRSALLEWLTASRLGWEENYRDPAIYPRMLRGAPLVESRTLEQEVYANEAFRPLVQSTHGILSLSPELIDGMISYLNRTGLSLRPEAFAALR